MNQKDQINPFKAYGTKEVWEKINESGKNKEVIISFKELVCEISRDWN